MSHVFTHRTATDADNLDVLWPETTGRRLNRDQVLLITLEEGRILAGAVLFHGGHEFAMVGSVRIIPDLENPQWAARALWRWVAKWAVGQGITLVGHGASTEECREAMERLGGKPVKQQTLYEVAITP